MKSPNSPQKKNNYCYLVGNLGMDPVARGKGKTPLVGFSVAENVQKYDEESQTYKTLHTNWFNVTLFGDAAVAAQKQLRKGDRVVIEGRMRMSKFTTRAGEARTGFEILADKVTPWRKPGELEINPEDLPF